jgi:flavodoxin
MSTQIAYFSGTGNSLAVARALAERLGAALRPIAATLDWDRVALADMRHQASEHEDAADAPGDGGYERR